LNCLGALVVDERPLWEFSSGPGRSNLTQHCKQFATASTITPSSCVALALWRGDGQGHR